MRRMFVFLGVLLVGVLGVGALGLLISPVHQATASVQIPDARVAAWRAFLDVAYFQYWRPDVEAAQLLTPYGERPTWREFHPGGGFTTVEVAQWDAPRFFTSRVVDPDPPVRWSRSYTFVEEGEHTRVEAREDAAVSNPYRRIVDRLRSGPRTRLEAELEAFRNLYLRAEAEAEARERWEVEGPDVPDGGEEEEPPTPPAVEGTEA